MCKVFSGRDTAPLSLAKRFEAYETMGTLFKAFKDIMLQQNYSS